MKGNFFVSHYSSGKKEFWKEITLAKAGKFLQKNTVSLCYLLEYMEEKKMIRRDILRERNGLSSQQHDQYSAQICEIVLREIQAQFPEVARILFFAPFQKEVNIMPLWEQLKSLSSEYYIFFPRIKKGEAGGFAAVAVQQSSDLIAGEFGIHEPFSEEVVSPEILDLVLVPAVAVDAEGNRIGYGGGYYDRFLKKTAPHCRTWAIVFSQQKVEKIPAERHDRTVQVIVDETGFWPV